MGRKPKNAKPLPPPPKEWKAPHLHEVSPAWRRLYEQIAEHVRKKE